VSTKQLREADIFSWSNFNASIPNRPNQLVACKGLNNKLTHCSRALLEKLTVAQTFKEIHCLSQNLKIHY
jgi:hypothetical protein